MNNHIDILMNDNAQHKAYSDAGKNFTFEYYRTSAVVGKV